MSARGLTAVALLVFTAPLRANVGPPSVLGQVVREPTGLEQVTITRETLTIDLGPLADGGPARVHVLYKIDNAGTARTLDLRFLGGSPMSAFEVLLDDEVVPSAPASVGEEPPESWKPPRTTPGLHGPPLGYGYRRAAAVAFRPTLRPGPHTLVAKYHAEVGRYLAEGPTLKWQLAYILAPARAWAGFGGLDVTVTLPPGWEAATDPPLERAGDELRGHFDTIPADALALTVAAPAGVAYHLFVIGSWVVFVIVALGGAVECGWIGRQRARQGRPAWGVVAGVAILWSVVLAGTGAVAIFAPESALPEGQVAHYGYCQIFAMAGIIALSVIAVPVGFVIGIACWAPGVPKPRSAG
jgi:hypothetical protein